MKKSFPAIAAAAALLVVGTPVLTTSPAQAAPSTECTNSSAVAIDKSGNMIHWRIANPMDKVSFDSNRTVGQRAQNIRIQAQIDDDLLLALPKSGGEYTLYKLGAQGYETLVSGGSGWNDITRIVPQGNGVFYAIHKNGDMTMHSVTKDRKGINSEDQKIGSGWDKYTNVVGSGRGHVYAQYGKDILHFYREAWKDTKGKGFGPAEVTKGTLPDLTELQGLGTTDANQGILFGFTKSGVAARIIVDNNKKTFTASNSDSTGWQDRSNVTIAAGHCGKAPEDSQGSLRTRVLEWSRRIMDGERIPATDHSVAWTKGTRPPYVYGGGHGDLAGPSGGGVDCSGFARWVYALASGGKDVLGAFTTYDMKTMNQLERIPADQVQPGDLAWHPTASDEHVMVVKSIGGGRFVSYEAKSTADGLHDDVSRSVDNEVFYRVKG